MRIVWSDEFKLGVPAMDADHAALVELCNDFVEAAHAPSGIASLTRPLDVLIQRTRAHFLDEERMLDRHNYPGLVQHKAEHERLLAQLDHLQSRFADEDQHDHILALATETADFLKDWLLEHIRHNDRPYRPFLMSLA